MYNLHIKQNHNYFVEGALVSNCHGIRANVVKELINVHGSLISHRYGVTGTFPKPLTDQYSLKISIGQIIREVPASWLIEQGYLSRVEIEPMETQDDDPELPDYASERAYISKNEERIEALAKMIQQKRNFHGNTMVLVNSIPQGRVLQDLIPGSIFLSGESAKELRQENYSSYAERDDVIVIATAGIASTGLSIDRIFCLILVDAGKSFIRAVQSIGRGLRKKGDKKEVYVVDVHSKLKFARKHFSERKKYYRDANYPLTKMVKLTYV